MKQKKIILCLLIGLMLAAVCIGCGKAIPPKPIAMVVLLGSHANSQKVDIELHSRLEEVYLSHGNLSLIVVDGNPQIQYDPTTGLKYGHLSVPLDANDYDYWKFNYVDPQIARTNNALKSIEAEDEEVDTLKSLQVAADELKVIVDEIGEEANQSILVLDNGLCTTGALDFRNGQLNKLLFSEMDISSDPVQMNTLATILNELEAKKEIPNLEGVTVSWYGLGMVLGTQPDLSALCLNNLRIIWGELLKRSGAITDNNRNSYFIPVGATQMEQTGPFVSPVIPLAISDPPVFTSTPMPTQSPINESPHKISYIFFIANEANYLDGEADAIEKLRPVAEMIKESVEQKYLLVGTTSSYNGGDAALAKKRAEKVYGTLIELHVNSEQLETIGIGYAPETDFCHVDRDKNGGFLEEEAQWNRAVWLVLADTDMAKQAQNSLSAVH